ncbi:MAG: glycosyltransferase [Chloroflexota bacterium]
MAQPESLGSAESPIYESFLRSFPMVKDFFAMGKATETQPELPFKILLMSRSIPPTPSGSAVIVGNLARQFSRSEMVIVGAKSMGYPPVEWGINLPQRIYASLHPPDDLRGGRWLRWLQFPFVLLISLYVMLTQRCDVILAVFPDEIYLLAAYWLSRLLKRPLFAYFHNTYVENRPVGSIFHKLAVWLQARIFAHARHVFVMSEGMQQLYRERYPGLKCTPLVHTFNELPADLEQPVEVPKLHQPLDLVLTGNIGAYCADATARIVRAVTELQDARLSVYSGTSRQALKSVGIDGTDIEIDTITRDQLLVRLRQADILLLPHGFTGRIASEEIRTIFPTRTIEYLLAERPILAHLPANCFLADFLTRYNCGLLVTEASVEAIKDAILRLAQDPTLQRQLVENARLAAQQFYAPTVNRHLREVLQTAYATPEQKLAP